MNAAKLGELLLRCNEDDLDREAWGELSKHLTRYQGEGVLVRFFAHHVKGIAHYEERQGIHEQTQPYRELHRLGFIPFSDHLTSPNWREPNDRARVHLARASTEVSLCPWEQIHWTGRTKIHLDDGPDRVLMLPLCSACLRAVRPAVKAQLSKPKLYRQLLKLARVNLEG
ncbi:MAG: hypothetical protein ACYTFG_00045 [Planctomycetota bacterium]|jgi:hypothetical protein